MHAVAARYTQAGSAPGLNSPGCTPLVFKYGACPSERAAAGNTPQEVRQSALGALGALLGAIPLFDFLDATAIGGAAEDSGLADAAAASCGGMSFSPGTKVLLASGLAVPIAILKPGEKVLATNVKTGKTSAEPVTAVLVHHDTNRYDLRVKTAHGTAIIHTTTTHLFWNPATRRWVKAAALGSRSRLRTPGGTTALVVGGYDPNHRIGWMWDLTVRDDHDFYIRAAGDAVLVHNCPIPHDNGYLWPENNGFEGPTVRVSLREGYQFDRYGGIPETDSGRFASPAGTPFEMRSLPNSSLSRPLTTYEVATPFEAEVGVVRPWAGMPGGGFQLNFSSSIADLLKTGYIQVVP